jgi:uncharacterized protein (TIGR02147 family)
MDSQMDRPVIYRFMDYRSYLHNLIKFKKHQNTKFSYRYFSRKAGFASTNFISLVIKGKRNLTIESTAKLAKGFGLEGDERDFFEYLVAMNQASNHEEKNHYYQKMVSVKPFVKFKKIDKSKYEFFSKWYYPVILEIIDITDGCLGPDKLAKMLIPPISLKEAKEAFRILADLELIQYEGQKWRKCNQFITTGSEVKSMVAAQFHNTLLKISSSAIDAFPPNERDMSAMILSVNSKNMDAIKSKIDVFRNEIAELIKQEKETDRVICINIQTYPLSEIIK